MPVISDAQIAGAARAVGVPANKVATAVAIALAESGGNTHAHNAVPPDNSYGLWQINMLGTMGPERRRALGISNNDALYDPGINAKAMVMISKTGTNWIPWTTYTSGAYLRYMARGNAVGSGGTGDPLPPFPVPDLDPNTGLDNITNFLQTLTDRSTWIRLGLWFGGALLLLIGLTKMTGDNKLSEGTKSVGKAAVGLIPGGGTVMQGVKAATKVVK